MASDPKSRGVAGSGSNRFEPKTSNPKPLKESLNRFLANLGAPSTSVIAELSERWPEVVGPALASETTPVSLLDGELLVSCSDSAWASQVSWCDAQIKQHFQQLYPQAELNKITARVTSG